jgi:hypothetical protein
VSPPTRDRRPEGCRANAPATRRRAAGDDAPDRIGTVAGVRETTDAAIEAITTSDDGDCPHFGHSLPENGAPMCPGCGAPYSRRHCLVLPKIRKRFIDLGQPKFDGRTHGAIRRTDATRVPDVRGLARRRRPARRLYGDRAGRDADRHCR